LHNYSFWSIRHETLSNILFYNIQDSDDICDNLHMKSYAVFSCCISQTAKEKKNCYDAERTSVYMIQSLMQCRNRYI